MAGVRDATRRAAFRSMAIVLLVSLCGGCSTQHLRYEQGALLRTDTTRANWTWEPRIAFREVLDGPKPYLVVWVEAPAGSPMLVQAVYEKVGQQQPPPPPGAEGAGEPGEQAPPEAKGDDDNIIDADYEVKE